MTQDKEQLVAEGAMEKMSVAPPDPERSQEDPSERGGQGGESLMQKLKEKPTEHRLDQDTVLDAAPPGESGVADEDPLSAHPT